MSYLVRQVMLPLRLPMRVSEREGGLLQAVPRSDYTVFATVDEATRAIGETIQRRGDALFEVVTVEQHLDDQSRISRRAKAVKR